MKVNLIEYTNILTKNNIIDETNGIVRNVKIVGLESRNGRIYPEDTLKKAVNLYENSKVNLNHSDENNTCSRKYQDRFGAIKNIRYKPNDGLYADFYFNPKHVLAEQFLWDAKNRPENLGMSHNVEAIVSKRDNKQIVDEILSVKSVDIVADPATTNGLFESVNLNEVNRDNMVVISHMPDVTEKVCKSHMCENNQLQENNSDIFCAENTKKQEWNLQLENLRNDIISLILEHVLESADTHMFSFPVYTKEFVKSLLTIQDITIIKSLLQERYEYCQNFNENINSQNSDEIQSRPSDINSYENDKSFIESILK
ncbi:MAG: hypothetical protein Q4C95_08755 [Planctomycetia bacterium]|nr:hypothetical protein [Planctomycetia bacterium]